MMEKEDYQKAEIFFKKAMERQDIPNAYYGLALLYYIPFSGKFFAKSHYLSVLSDSVS